MIGETSGQMALRILAEAWTEHQGPQGGKSYVNNGDESTKAYTRPANTDGVGVQTAQAML